MIYTLDTNTIIYYLHADQGVRRFVDISIQNKAPIYISVITETELLRYRRLTNEEESAIVHFLSGFSTIPLDSFLARKAGAVGRAYNLKLADSIIAATALFTGSTLVTRNVRDFKRVPDLSVEKI